MLYMGRILFLRVFWLERGFCFFFIFYDLIVLLIKILFYCLYDVFDFIIKKLNFFYIKIKVLIENYRENRMIVRYIKINKMRKYI